MRSLPAGRVMRPRSWVDDALDVVLGMLTGAVLGSCLGRCLYA